MSTDVRFFGGVDWASETHQVCLVAADGKIIGERAFAHGGAGLAEMCDWLVTTSGEEPPTVAVAIEVPHGPVVEILLERRFQVDAVNPKQLDRFRDRFTVAGAKDDRRDAYVLADALRTDRHCFRRLTVEDPVVIELREWSRMVDRFAGDLLDSLRALIFWRPNGGDFESVRVPDLSYQTDLTHLFHGEQDKRENFSTPDGVAGGKRLCRDRVRTQHRKAGIP